MGAVFFAAPFFAAGLFTTPFFLTVFLAGLLTAPFFFTTFLAGFLAATPLDEARPVFDFPTEALADDEALRFARLFFALAGLFFADLVPFVVPPCCGRLAFFLAA
ncbi:MAG: hypothetical protein AB2827_10685 [Candidatus Thiodiazotropha sp.]